MEVLQERKGQFVKVQKKQASSGRTQLFGLIVPLEGYLFSGHTKGAAAIIKKHNTRKERK